MQEAEQIDLLSQGIALRHVLRTQGSLLLDHFTSSIASEYQRGRERAAHSPELRRMERVAEAARRWARRLRRARLRARRLAPRPDRDGARDGETVGRLAAGLGRDLLSVSRSERPSGRGSAAAPTGGRTLERPVGENAPGVSLAIGEPGRGVDGWRLSHHQGQAAILITLHRPQRPTRYADVALLAAVLRDRELARSLVEIHLSPLDGERDGGAGSRRRCAPTSPRAATRRQQPPHSGWTGTRSNAACT